jgi:hypothetical protein
MYLEDALRHLRAHEGDYARRWAWKPLTYVFFYPGDEHLLSFLAVSTPQGTAPWTPTRCDMMTADWYVREKSK